MALGHSVAQGGRGGIFEWGRGYGVQNNFVTVMAYPFLYGSAVSVQQFSSPTQNKCKGLPCGVPHDQNRAADSVTSLNTVAKQVSDFYSAKVPSSDVGNDPTPPADSTPPADPVPPTDPVPPVEPTPKNPNNIVTNGNFDNLGSWKNFWELSSLEQSDFKFSSNFGLKVSDRRIRYSGVAQTIAIEKNKTYQLTAQGSLATSYEARDNLRAGLVLHTPRGLFLQPLKAVSVVRGQWTKLERTFKVNTTVGDIDSIELLFYGPRGGRSFYLDEVALKVK
jgi:hypothetical protein